MKDIALALMMLFSSGDSPIEAKLSNEEIKIVQLKGEIKDIQRKIEWIEVSNKDYAGKYLRIRKLNQSIVKKQNEIKSLVEKAELKRKWRTQDSLDFIKKYPPIELLKQNDY